MSTVSDPVVLSQLSALPSGLDALILSASHHHIDFSKHEYDPAGNHEVTDLGLAHVTGSRLKGTTNRHALLLDIDHPAWLLPSSTPGHHHLYVDIECGFDDLVNFLRAAERIGLVEKGYVACSRERGWTSLRLPWIRKVAA